MKFASDLKGPSRKKRAKNTTAEFLLSLINSANLWRDCKRKQIRLNNNTLNPLQCQSFMMEKNKQTK